MRVLADARPGSPAVQEAHLEVVLVQAKKLMDRWPVGRQPSKCSGR